MRLGAAIVLGLFGLAAFTAGAQGDAPVVRKHRVGPVAIGATAQSVYEAFAPERRRLVDLGLEGCLTPALELTLAGSKRPGGVVAELVPRGGELIVWRIAVTDPAILTEKGVGPGSTVAALRAAHRADGVISGEGRVFIQVEELSASFELDTSGPGGENLWRLEHARDVPPGVKIVGVLLTE